MRQCRWNALYCLHIYIQYERWMNGPLSIGSQSTKGQRNQPWQTQGAVFRQYISTLQRLQSQSTSLASIRGALGGWCVIRDPSSRTLGTQSPFCSSGSFASLPCVSMKRFVANFSHTLTSTQMHSEAQPAHTHTHTHTRAHTHKYTRTHAHTRTHTYTVLIRYIKPCRATEELCLGC